jgi:endonuclease YncB( thermonuclease family)
VSVWECLIFAVMLGAALLLQSCDQLAATPKNGPAVGPSRELTVLRPGALTGPVTHVRDGDTIEVARKPIRLQGLNCNEKGTPLREAACRHLASGHGRRNHVRTQRRDDI